MHIILLCLKIFIARVFDVSLGTVRTILTVKGKTLISGLIAFVEVSVWFAVVKEALNTSYQSLYIPIAYASGYATGTIIGTFISKKYIKTLVSVEVLTNKATKKNIEFLQKEGFSISKVQATHDSNNKSSILFITINSKYLDKLKNLITKIDEQAFIVINESKIIHNGLVK